jgi:mRNA-degrading endonuclease RelE of RelBE toxin-antitoxin system
MTKDLSNNPEKHQIDKLKIDNDGTWRAFEKFHYRISYRIFNDEILIIRMRHTSMSPDRY